MNKAYIKRQIALGQQIKSGKVHYCRENTKQNFDIIFSFNFKQKARSIT